MRYFPRQPHSQDGATHNESNPCVCNVCYTIACYVFAVLCYVTVGYVILCCVMLCYAMLCYVRMDYVFYATDPRVEPRMAPAAEQAASWPCSRTTPARCSDRRRRLLVQRRRECVHSV